VKENKVKKKEEEEGTQWPLEHWHRGFESCSWRGYLSAFLCAELWRQWRGSCIQRVLPLDWNIL